MTDKTIAQLPAADPLSTSDEFPIWQGGATKKATQQQIVDALVGSGEFATAAQGAAADSAVQSAALSSYATTAAVAAGYQPLATVLTNTTAAFTTAQETKLSGIESGADVTDATNVAAAGAVMTSEKGAANGIAPLGADSKISTSYLPSAVLGAANYQGVWNASTNSPTLTSGTGTKGYYYVVDVAGATDLDGITDWKLGDWAIYSGTAWQKVDNTDAVISVNGSTGAVVLDADDISDSATTNKWATSGEKTKLGYISVSQSVDLDALESAFAGTKIVGVYQLASNQATAANTTPVDLSGLVFSYEANSTYEIEIIGAVSSAAATTGYSFQLNLSSAVTSVWLTGSSQLANTGTVSAFSSIADDASVGVTSGVPTLNTAVPVMGRGLLITTSNTGTAQLRYRSETTAVTTCLAGTTMIVTKIK
jgi:hypothetical protein